MLEALLFIGSALCAVLYGARWTLQPISPIRTAVKTCASLGLAGIAALVGPPLLVAALLAGAVGDFALSRPRASGFLPGLLAFALGHLLYIILLYPLAGDVPWLGLAVLILLAGALLIRLWGTLGPLRLPVLFYSALSVVLGALALALPPEAWLICAGALLFIASDCILAVELFLLPDDHPWRAILARLLWALYWVGQAGLLFGVFRFYSATA